MRMPHIFASPRSAWRSPAPLDEAREHAAALRTRVPGYGIEDFLRAFRFDPEGERRFREGARRIGLG